MHVYEQKWIDKKKKKGDGCMSMNKSGQTPKKQKKERKDACP